MSSIARNYLNQLNADYLQVHRRKEDLFWSTYMGTSDDQAGFTAAEQAYKAFCADPARLPVLRQMQAQPRRPSSSAVWGLDRLLRVQRHRGSSGCGPDGRAGGRRGGAVCPPPGAEADLAGRAGRAGGRQPARRQHGAGRQQRRGGAPQRARHVPHPGAVGGRQRLSGHRRAAQPLRPRHGLSRLLRLQGAQERADEPGATVRHSRRLHRRHRAAAAPEPWQS